MYECFLLPETNYQESTPYEDHNHVIFDGKEKIDVNNMENETTKNDQNHMYYHPQDQDNQEECPFPDNFAPEEECMISIQENEPLQQEILIVRDQHYRGDTALIDSQPITPSPNWVIITSDNRLSSILPIRCDISRGLIIGREQAQIREGYLEIRTNITPKFTTIEEFKRSLLDLRRFFGPCRPSQIPFRLCDNNPQIVEIAKIFNATIFNHFSIKIKNINNFTNNNKMINVVQIQNNDNRSIDLSNNIKQVSISETNSLTQMKTNNTAFNMNNMSTDSFQCNNLKIEPRQNEMTIYPRVDTLEIKPEHNNLVLKPTVQNLVMEPRNETLTSHPVVQNHISEPINTVQTSKPISESHLNEPEFKTRISYPISESHLNEPEFKTKTSKPTVENHKIEPINSVKISNPITESHLIEPKNETITSKPIVENHKIEPINSMKVSNPISESHINEPEYKTVISHPEVYSHGINVKQDTLITEATIQNLEIKPKHETINETATIQNAKVNVKYEEMIHELTIKYPKFIVNLKPMDTSKTLPINNFNEILNFLNLISRLKMKM